LHAAIGHTPEGESATKVDSITAVGFTAAHKHPIVGFTGVVAKENVKLLLVVSTNSLDSVERIRQTPSDESARGNFADVVCSMVGAVKGVYGE
jgi:hypothetical protein